MLRKSLHPAHHFFSLRASFLSILLLAAVCIAGYADAQTISALYTFQDTPDGSQVYGRLAGDKVGNLYGVTSQGGANNMGAIFKLDPSGNETILHSFDGVDGTPFYTGLVRDAQNNLYGVTLGGGAYGQGTVFKVDSAGNFQSLYSFSGPDGSGPYAGSVVRDPAGNLYGTTTQGGANGLGTVFKLDPAGSLTVLHSFSAPEGDSPTAGLIRDSQGNLYGTAENDGAFGGGTVFKLDPDGNLTVLHSFSAATDGAAPVTTLAADTRGNFYGTTVGGGAYGNGTVYKVDASGNLTVLHSFDSSADGVEPFGTLVWDNAGNLWGTTETEGPLSHGAIYKVDPNGHFNVVFDFSDTSVGSYPFGGIIRDAAGNLYGGTTGGGLGSGTIYKISF